MRHQTRRLAYRVVTATSLVALMTLSGVWVWSYLRPGVDLERSGEALVPEFSQTYLYRGEFRHRRVADPAERDPIDDYLNCFPESLVHRPLIIRYVYNMSQDPYRKDANLLTIDWPIWMPWAICLTLCTALIVPRLLRGKTANGFCICGYDLRASPDRCPECGRFAA